MCGSMVDIQSATAEIRWGKKEEQTTGWKYIWPALLHRAAINNGWMLMDFPVEIIAHTCYPLVFPVPPGIDACGQQCMACVQIRQRRSGTWWLEWRLGVWMVILPVLCRWSTPRQVSSSTRRRRTSWPSGIHAALDVSIHWRQSPDVVCLSAWLYKVQELIRRWDSERELLCSVPGSYPNSLK